MAALCSLFQQPGDLLFIGLLMVLDPWIWNLAAVVRPCTVRIHDCSLPPPISPAEANGWHGLDILACNRRLQDCGCCSQQAQPVQPVAQQAVLSSQRRAEGGPEEGLRVSLLLAGPRSASNPQIWPCVGVPIAGPHIVMRRSPASYGVKKSLIVGPIQHELAIPGFFVFFFPPWMGTVSIHSCSAATRPQYPERDAGPSLLTNLPVKPCLDRHTGPRAAAGEYCSLTLELLLEGAEHLARLAGQGPTRSAAPRASCTTFVGFASSLSTCPDCTGAHLPMRIRSTEPAVTRNGVRWR